MTDGKSPVPAVMVPGRNGGTIRRGGGRPPKAETHLAKEVRALLKEGAVDAAKGLLMQAKRGNIKAAELVLAYVIGKPTEKLEVSGPEGGPIEVLQGLNDHERRALKDAIDRELAAREVTA